MAQQIILIDDIDGTTDDVESIEFALEGSTYTIDLGADNAEALREALSTYIEHAQRVGGPARAQRRRKTATPPAAVEAETRPKEDLAAIRDWARENGYGVSDRGRIAQSVKDAYAAAS